MCIKHVYNILLQGIHGHLRIAARAARDLLRRQLGPQEHVQKPQAGRGAHVPRGVQLHCARRPTERTRVVQALRACRKRVRAGSGFGLGPGSAR